MTRYYAASIQPLNSLGSAIQAGFAFSTNVNNTLKDKFEEIKRFYLLNYIIPCYFSASNREGALDIESDSIRKNFIAYLVDSIPLDFLELSTEERASFIDGCQKLFNESVKKKELEDEACPICVEDNKAIKANTPTGFADFFTSKNAMKTSTKEAFQIDQEKFSRAMNTANCYDFIMNYLDSDQLSPDAEALETKIKEHCDNLSKQFDASKPEQLLGFYKVIYVLEDDTKLQNINNIYTSKSELRLGKDIKTIAVDEANIDTVRALCRRNNIINLDIVSIDSLTQAHQLGFFNNINCLANPIIKKIEDIKYPKLMSSTQSAD